MITRLRRRARTRTSGLLRHLPLTALLAVLPLSAAPAAAQMDHDDPDHHVKEAMSVLEFREIGPTIMSGRVVDLAVNEANPSNFFVGTASGGIWRTDNMGISFEPIFLDQATASIGDVTLAPSNPNVLWVGSGEPQNRQSSPWGNGVYRTVDGGRTWSHLGLEDTHHISRIAVHPMDPDVAYVAAMGHLWGPNETRGVFKTTDGGQSWDKILYVDEHTGVIDLIMDPNDPNTLFAATYQRQRRAWGYNGGGPGSGIWRTYDGGATWTELTEGLPQGDMGRIGLDIYRGDSNLMFAVVQADASGPGGGGDEDGVYRSRDRGDTWEHIADQNNRPMYYSLIRVDPTDPNRLYQGGANGFRSNDGGVTWTSDAASGVHLDHHAWWINPENSDHQILGSDGGVSITWDRSDSWYQFRNLPISQFYEVGVDNQWPYHVCGGLQDNGSWCAPSETWSNQGIRTRDWYNVSGGDGFFTVMHPEDSRVMFSESQGGNIGLVDREGRERRGVRPVAMDENGEEIFLRRNWNSPIVLSRHDSDRVYYGAQFLFRSDDLAHSWERISDDLTYAIDRNELEIMGVPGSEPQMSRNDGQSSYGNLTAVAESPVDENVLYTGADDGRLMRTMDGGSTWDDITGNVPGLPDNVYVTRIVASNAAAGSVVAAFDNHRSDDYAPYVYRSTNHGDSWELIVEGLPMTSVNALAQHPENANLWFVGNEVGVYVSVNGGDRWVRMEGLGLPTVPVDDIQIQGRDNDLVIGTHGRGIWIMDDIGPLSDLDADATLTAVDLFSAENAVSYNVYRPQGWTPGIWQADEPGYGLPLRFHFNRPTAEMGGEYMLAISDASGNVVREYTGNVEAGMHQRRWDLRLAMRGPDGEWMDAGPRVLPGTYTATLSVEGVDDAASFDFEVIGDPRSQLTRAQVMARHEAMLDSYRLSAYADAADDAITEAVIQIEGAMERMAALEAEDTPLYGRLEAAIEQVEELNSALNDADNGANAWGGIQGMHRPASEQQMMSIDRSWEELPGVISDINAFTATIPALLAEVAGVAMPDAPDAIPTVAMPNRGGM